MNDFLFIEPVAIMMIVVVFIIIYFCRSYFLSHYNGEKWRGIETVIFVKNAQDEIEGIVKSYYSRQIRAAELMIVDCGSSDQTPQILERLSMQYMGLKLLLLSDLPFQLCAQEALKHTSGPAMLLVNGTALNYKEVIKLIDPAFKKNVGIGLKSYEK